ncbi:MAG: ABC transporter ATP-binding protein [Candidatus Hodarchaeales archaeon]|jgi:ABC-2 type transport system ATP-binding protein
MSLVIEARNIKKSFGKREKKVQAVNGISLSIQEGEIFGFLGPNGAGKTTSLKIFMGLLEADSGDVVILGQKPTNKNIELKLALGIIPQEIVLYNDLTVEENLRFIAEIYDIPKKIARERIDTLISQMGLEEKRKSLVRTLSGGQKRRLNVIMGLIHEPKIILCDEPTPGLDPQSRIVVWDFLKKLPKEGKTVILTTHFMEEADRLCDRVAIIDHGEILVLDTPDALKGSIGEGDLVEISLNDEEELKLVEQSLKEFQNSLDIKIISNQLHIRSKDIISNLNKILAIIEELQIEVKNINIRRTSLEDVFIDLTGRKLRN